MIKSQPRLFMRQICRLFCPIFLFILCALRLELFAEEKTEDELFILFSPPKSGTFLAADVLSRITKKEAVMHLDDFPNPRKGIESVIKAFERNGFMVAHNFNLKMINFLVKKGVKIIFLLRDPRDQLISMMNWMREGQWNWLKVARIRDQNKQIDELITGSRYGWKCVEDCILERASVVHKLSPDTIYYVYFENLVGVEGGGTLEQQIEEIQNLANFLKIELTIDEITTIANSIYGNSGTFRTGQIGTWKKYFTQRHKDSFKRRYNKYLRWYGYETNAQW